MRVAFLLLCAVGCSKPQAPAARQSASTVALSTDDAFVYVTDADNGLVSVVDAKAEAKLYDVTVGARPGVVVVGSDDTVYVANRGSGSVSVIRRGEHVEAMRWAAGLEPVGLAPSSDGHTLYVVSAVADDTATHGALRAIDTLSGLTSWQLPLGEEPRSIALIDDRRAVVTLFKRGLLEYVDLEHREVTLDADVYPQLNAIALGSTGAGTGVRVRALSAVAVTTDARVLATGGLAPEGQPKWGDCTPVGLVEAPALLELTLDGEPRVEDVLDCTQRTVIANRDAPWPQQGPAALAIDQTNEWIYVAMQHSNSVLAFRPGGWEQVTVSSPDGVAITSDNRRAFVHSAFDHAVGIVRGGTQPWAVSTTIPLAGDTLSPDEVEGRKLFFDAADRVMTSRVKGVACATCHLEGGHEDGHVWQFPEGRRQTMSLAGRHLSETGPYHWDGAFLTLSGLMIDTVQNRMGGTGMDLVGAAKVSAYLATLLAPPSASSPSPRGEQLFAQAECGVCHGGAALTDHRMLDVGTGGAFDVPSLLGSARTAPYLHDGSAATLLERLQQGRALDQHGKTSALDDDDLAELARYLESL